MATAGSKEAKQLEQIKNTFDKAYKEMGKVSEADSNLTTEGDSDTKFSLHKDNKGNEYWQIDSGKDIFKNLKTKDEYVDAAFNYLIKNRDNKITVKDKKGKEIQFIRISAEEFTNSKESQQLYNDNPEIFKKKMRMIPSLQDILLNATADWHSPDHKNHKLFKEGGFNNYKGRVRIDNVIFKTIVRNGVAKFGDVFYDINLEVDTILPHAKDASEINVSTSSEYSISAEGAKNNTKYSLSDNQGRELTKKQQEYFKDSKVRDENGSLLTVYHGTNSDFTVFDRGKIGENYWQSGNSAYGGFYFTDKESSAESYAALSTGLNGKGRVVESYLNITNPLIRETGRDAFEFFDDHSIELLQEADIAENDGIIIKGEKRNLYIVFTSEQIKNTDNTNPTSNPDIRFSLSDSQDKKVAKDEQENIKEKILNEFGLNSVNDYVHVQKKVLETLGNDFFGEVIVENTGMIVDIGKKGIKETFGPGKRFQTLPRELKLCKLAVVKQLPELIKKAQLVEGDVKNLHGENKTSMFDYLETSTEINGVPCKVKIDIKKSQVKNKFWMHRVEIENEQNLNLPYRNSKGINEVSAHTLSISDVDVENNSELSLAPTKDYRIYGKDIKLKDNIAPVNINKSETISKKETVNNIAPVNPNIAKEEPAPAEAESKKSQSTDKPARPLLRTEMKSISRSIKRSYGSTFDPTKDIMRLYNAMHSGKLTDEEAAERATEIGRNIAENIKSKPMRTSEAQEVLDMLRNSRIKLDVEQISEVSKMYDGYNNYKQSI